MILKSLAYNPVPLDFKPLQEVNDQIEELQDIVEDEKETKIKGGVEYDVQEVWEAIKWVKKKNMSKFVEKLTSRQIDWFLEVHRDGKL